MVWGGARDADCRGLLSDRYARRGNGDIEIAYRAGEALLDDEVESEMEPSGVDV
jgi:hypothetical protein